MCENTLEGDITTRIGQTNVSHEFRWIKQKLQVLFSNLKNFLKFPKFFSSPFWNFSFNLLEIIFSRLKILRHCLKNSSPLKCTRFSKIFSFGPLKVVLAKCLSFSEFSLELISIEISKVRVKHVVQYNKVAYKLGGFRVKSKKAELFSIDDTAIESVERK